MTTTAPALPSPAERAASGKSLRERVPRSVHSNWSPAPDRRDPLEILAETNRGRVAKLIPLRYERMATSAFAFCRGSAAVMAADLATTLDTEIEVQLCGDAHVLNFGAYATPERRLIFDVVDFDETLPGPWEWDVKRLAASIVLAAREIGLKHGGESVSVLSAIRGYRTRMHEFATESALHTWYARIDAHGSPKLDGDDRRKRKPLISTAHATSMRAAVAKYTEITPQGRRLRDEPPVLYHAPGPDDGGFDVEKAFATYAASLAPETRVLFERYRLVDSAVKVVGIGSVGMRCSIALFEDPNDEAIILQIKEATRSVMEPYLVPSVYRNGGERAVRGQRLMQSASDALLGFGSADGRDFYIRQFKDKKVTVDVTGLDGHTLPEYAGLCGEALAGAHARSGDPVVLAGYLGKGVAFDRAICRFALAYADQIERDYALFLDAYRAGTLPV